MTHLIVRVLKIIGVLVFLRIKLNPPSLFPSLGAIHKRLFVGD